MPRAIQHKNVVTTSYDFVDPAELKFNDERVIYAQWQLEKCPETGRLHVHHAIWCTKKVAESIIQKWIGDKTAHIETMISTPKAKEYTMKEESRVAGPWEYGDFTKITKQGERTDLTEMKKAIENGATEEDLVENHLETFARHERFADRLMQMRLKRRFLDEMPDVTVLVGMPGTGKTHRAWEMCGRGKETWYKSDREKYFAKYMGEKNIIVNDFNPDIDEVGITAWLNILDKWPAKLRLFGGNSGGFTECQANKFVFTTNFDPETRWWPDHDQHDALMRRITRIIHMDVPYEGGTFGEVNLDGSVGTVMTPPEAAMNGASPDEQWWSIDNIPGGTSETIEINFDDCID